MEKKVGWPVRLHIFKSTHYLLGILLGAGKRAVKFLPLRRIKTGNRKVGRWAVRAKDGFIKNEQRGLSLQWNNIQP